LAIFLIDTQVRIVRGSIYEVAKVADITVSMGKNHTAKVNHAYKGKLTDKEILGSATDIRKVLSD
jgi:hypothetical protein